MSIYCLSQDSSCDIDTAMSHPIRHRRKLKDPVPLNKLIHGHTKRWRIQALHRLEVIRRAWREIAGDYVAEHVHPVRLTRKTLRLATEDSAWASEVSYLTGDLLERIQKLVPEGWVTDIHVVTSEPLPTEATTIDSQVALPAPTPTMIEKTYELTRIALDPDADPELVALIQRAALVAIRRNSIETK